MDELDKNADSLKIPVDDFEIYKELNEIQRYEGAGIWSRFNIIVSVHVALFAIVAFLYSSNQSTAHYLVLFVCVGGALIAVWGIYVLQRLWKWHIHWKLCLIDVEQRFSDEQNRIFSKNRKRGNKHKSKISVWFLSYTQPFLLIIMLIWISIGSVVATTIYTSANNTNDDIAEEKGANEEECTH